MYLRTIKRKNKDGSVVEYVQLAHNIRHPQKGYPKAEVIHSFGRREQLDVDGLKRLVASIGRFIELDGPAPETDRPARAASLRFIRSRPFGGVYLLHGVWERLQIGACLERAAESKDFPASVTQALFARVADSALAPYAPGAFGGEADWEDVPIAYGGDLRLRPADDAAGRLAKCADAFRQALAQVAEKQLGSGLDTVFAAGGAVHGDLARICGRLKPPDDGAAASMLDFWLALLLTRWVEIRTGMDWDTVAREMQRLHLGEFRDGERRLFLQTELAGPQLSILEKLDLDPPRWDADSPAQG